MFSSDVIGSTPMTPGIASTSEASKSLKLPRICGGRAQTTGIASGTGMSRVYWNLPVQMSRAWICTIGFPTTLSSAEVLTGTSSRGRSSWAATELRSPKAIWRPSSSTA
jgi:hypothetical protein